jgi:hypothetical protein
MLLATRVRHVTRAAQVGFRLLGVGDFTTIASNMADQGLLALGGSGEPSRRRVTLRMLEEDVALALKGSRVLSNLLNRDR